MAEEPTKQPDGPAPGPAANPAPNLAGLYRAMRHPPAGIKDIRTWRVMVREWLRACSHASTVHHQDEVSRMIRMVAARGAGVDPIHFDVPFPGAQVENNEEHHYHLPAPVPGSAGGGFGLLGKLLLGGLIGMAGAGLGVGGMLLGSLLSKPSSPPPAVSAPGTDAQIFDSYDGGKTWKRVTP